MADQAENPSVLVFVGVFPPAFEASGPARSVAAIVRRLGDEFTFHVVTRANPDRPGPEPDVWTEWHGAQVLYLSGRRGALRSALAVHRGRRFDVLYLNSFFHRRFTWLPLLLWSIGRIRARRVVIAPRGEFSPGALAIGRRRKRTIIVIARLLRLHQRVEWQVSNRHERDDLHVVLGTRLRTIHVAQDLTDRLPAGVEEDAVGPASSDELRVVFLSRISPKKNLDGAIRAASRCSRPVHFVIAGPANEESYWHRCRGLIAEAPPNVRIEHVGEVAADDVVSLLGQSDVMFLPTHGENFGHVIAESLMAGTPVLISDQTPWSDIEELGAGWVRSPGDVGGFAEVLDWYATRTEPERARYRAAARRLADERLEPREAEDAHRRMFDGRMS